MTSLKAATKVQFGAQTASRVYAGTNWAWPPKVPMLAGLTIWLDASTSKWTNLAPGPQPTILGSPPPTFRTNALNGLPVVRITANAGQLRFTNTGIDKNYTLLFVARRWRITSGRVVTADIATSGANLLWGFHGNEFDSAYVEGWFNTPGPTGGVTSATQWRLYSGDHETTGTARLFSNGVLLGSHPSPPPTKGWGGTLNIGGYDAGRTQEADSEIAEFIMYNRKLSDAERQQVENYLRTKWAVPAPASFKPTDLGAALVGWFDAGDPATVQIVGSGVNNWVNKGVGPMTVTQTDNAKRPTYDGGATVMISNPQIFNVANSPAGFDVAMLAVPHPPGVGQWRTMFRNPNGPHLIIIENGSNRMGTFNVGTGFGQAGALTWDSVWGIAYARFSDGVAPTMSRDGSGMASTGSVVTAGNNSFDVLGAYYDGSQAWGYIRELLFLPYNTSDAHRSLLEGYLAHRWSMTALLPAGHPYKTFKP